MGWWKGRGGVFIVRLESVRMIGFWISTKYGIFLLYYAFTFDRMWSVVA